MLEIPLYLFGFVSCIVITMLLIMFVKVIYYDDDVVDVHNDIDTYDPYDPYNTDTHDNTNNVIVNNQTKYNIENTMLQRMV